MHDSLIVFGHSMFKHFYIFFIYSTYFGQIFIFRELTGFLFVSKFNTLKEKFKISSQFQSMSVLFRAHHATITLFSQTLSNNEKKWKEKENLPISKYSLFFLSHPDGYHRIAKNTRYKRAHIDYGCII